MDAIRRVRTVRRVRCGQVREAMWKCDDCGECGSFGAARCTFTCQVYIVISVSSQEVIDQCEPGNKWTRAKMFNLNMQTCRYCVCDPSKKWMCFTHNKPCTGLQVFIKVNCNGCIFHAPDSQSPTVSPSTKSVTGTKLRPLKIPLKGLKEKLSPHDYHYDKRSDSCYKYHKDKNNWYEALRICFEENGYLAIINSNIEAEVIKQFIKESSEDSKGSVYLGFRKNGPGLNWTSDWYTIQGQRLKDVGYSSGDINKICGRKYCGIMDKHDQTYNGAYCNYTFEFICEKEKSECFKNEESTTAPNVTLFTEPVVSTSIGPDVNASRLTTFPPDSGSSEKPINGTLTPGPSISETFETTDISSPVTHSTVTGMAGPTDNSSFNLSSETSTSVSESLTPSETASSVTNESPSSEPSTTASGATDKSLTPVTSETQPNVSESVGHTDDTTLAVTNFTISPDPNVTIFTEPVVSTSIGPDVNPSNSTTVCTDPGSIETPAHGYRYDVRTKNCYKYHRDAKNWYEALRICFSEDGYLAIINNNVEADVAIDIIEENSSASNRFVYLGFRRNGPGMYWKDDLYTIQGQNLMELDYVKFSIDEPNNVDGVEYCGAMDKEGQAMSDVTCDVRGEFLCEKDELKCRREVICGPAVSSSMKSTTESSGVVPGVKSRRRRSIAASQLIARLFSWS